MITKSEKNSKIRAVIVDDDNKICAMIKRYLEDHGFDVTACESGRHLREHLNFGCVDIIFLDINMPDEDGLDILGQMRSTNDVPLILLTGRGTVIDKVIGLELGADDYVTKPFSMRELLARAKSVLRRRHGEPVPVLGEPDGDAIEFDGWSFNIGCRQLRDRDGAVVVLTTGDFNMLREFVTRPGRVLSRDQLMDMTRGRHWAAYDRTIDAQVSRLRRKIEADPKNPTLIKSVHGIGYVFAGTISRNPSVRTSRASVAAMASAPI